MRSTSILLAGVALALAGVATPALAHTHHRHMTSSLHHSSTPAERQETAQLNQQQLAQAQNAGNSSMAVNSSGADTTATGTNVSSSTTGTATQQNSLTTEPAGYQRMRGSSGASTNGTAGGSTGTTGTAAGTSAAEGEQLGSPMNNDTQGNPSGAVSPPPPAGTSGTPQ